MNPFILYDNRFADFTPSATDTATGYDAANIKDLRTYTFWKAASSGTKYLTINNLVPKYADTLCIIGHNLYSVGAWISVESSPDNTTWTEKLAGFQVTDNRAICKLVTSDIKQYWRIKLSGTSAAAYIAVAMLGVRMEFPYPPDSPYEPQGQGIAGDALKSVTGNILGSTVNYYPVTLNPTFSLLTRTWVTDTYKVFWDAHGRLMKPFFWVWDLTAYPLLVQFVRMQPSATFSTPVSISGFVDSLSLAMEGAAEV